jgi:hypothetical protein
LCREVGLGGEGEEEEEEEEEENVHFICHRCSIRSKLMFTGA